MNAHAIHFVMALALGAGCSQADAQTHARGGDPRPPPSGGANCACDPPNPAYQGMHECPPAALDAGCRTYMSPGGPLLPPECAT